MKDPELMMYRVAIGQILADAGINRTTIREMLRESIKEKVEKHLGSVFEQTLREETSDYRIREAMRYVLKDVVREEMKSIMIEVNVTPKTKES